MADNFSRKILSWRVAGYVKASIRKETILDAIDTIGLESVIRVTNCGPENNFTSIQNYQTEIDHIFCVVEHSLFQFTCRIPYQTYQVQLPIQNGHP